MEAPPLSSSIWTTPIARSSEPTGSLHCDPPQEVRTRAAASSRPRARPCLCRIRGLGLKKLLRRGLPLRRIRWFGGLFMSATLVFAGFVPLSRPAEAASVSFIRDTEIENTIRVYTAPLFKAAGLDIASVELYLVKDKRLNARSEEHPSALQSLMRISYACFC